MSNATTICEALKELKTLDSRITKATSDPTFVTHSVGGKLQAAHKTEPEFATKAIGALKSVKDLIERRAKIKAAIVKSNAETSVTIGGVTYTVAGAIERKTSIAYEEKLAKYIALQLIRVNKEVDSLNENVKRSLDNHITTILGKDAKEKGGTEVEDFTAKYMAKNEAKILDPINATDEVTALENKIDAFLANVDTALSISNAITSIEID